MAAMDMFANGMGSGGYNMRPNAAPTAGGPTDMQTNGMDIRLPAAPAPAGPQYPWSKPVAPPVRTPSTGAQSPLAALIASLSGAAGNLGQNQEARQRAITEAERTRESYNKDDAFADAKGLMEANLQQSMEKSMGSLNRAAGGAGASQSSMMALLAQQAAQDAAQGAATLGAEQAVAYGQINNNSSSVLEQLTQTDPTEINALLAALGLQQDIRSQRSRDKLLQAQAEGPRQRQTFNNERPGGSIGAGAPRQQPVVMGGVATGGGGGGSPSTSSFFNRPGGILAGAGGGMTSYGPVPGADAALLYSAGGSLPSQYNGPGANSDLFTTGLKF